MAVKILELSLPLGAEYIYCKSSFCLIHCYCEQTIIQGRARLGGFTLVDWICFGHNSFYDCAAITSWLDNYACRHCINALGFVEKSKR